MCGIVAYLGKKSAQPILIEGLKRLEYRGYDSAGVALMSGGSLRVEKTSGRISVLEDILDGPDSSEHVGIGHTRWATHGKPNTVNAHPHLDTPVRSRWFITVLLKITQLLKNGCRKKGPYFSAIPIAKWYRI